MVKENQMSVKKASKIFQVPDTTLRDRVLQKVDPETAVFGKSPVLECFEEAKLVQHFKTMAAYGYGYTRQECVNIASEYAVHLGKRTMDKPFTMNWVRGFLKRWPELKVLKPRGLEHAQAKMVSKETVAGYFKNLEKTLSTHNIHDKPHLIYNIDEKGISIDHNPPSVVSDSTYCPQAVTSGRGKTITILGGGSASGVAIPPFFIFPGKRMRPELLNGASPGTSATVSETGWSNGVIFREYLENHFLKFVPRSDNQKVLLLLHRSHVSVDLIEWAQEQGIIIFILPAHTSHILQPMDVSCYGPLEKIYNSLCHKLMRESSATNTRYNVCEVAGKAYTRALSSENIQSGFRKSGIYPLNPEAIRMEYLAPAEVFKQISPITNTTPSEKNTHEDAENLDNEEDNGGFVMELVNKEKHLKEIKPLSKERKTLSKIVAGKEISDGVIEKMVEHERNQKGSHGKRKSTCVKKAEPKKKIFFVDETQQPGPSAINLISDDAISDSDNDTENIDPSKLCCICHRWQPEQIRNCVSLVFTKWAQCDRCNHWVHLIYCSPVRFVRRNDSFFCPHCTEE